MSDYSFILFIVLVVAVILAITYFNWQREKARSAAVEQFANDRMMTFTRMVASSAEYEPFYLTSRGRSKGIRNRVQGDIDGVDVSLFDYQFTTGSGKNSKTHRQSVVEFGSSRLSLAGFTIRPNQFLDGLRELAGKKSLELNDDPFNSRYNVYTLHDGDEEAVREQVDADVRQRLLRLNERWVVEGDGSRLLVWRQGKRVDASEFSRAVSEARELFDLFAESATWSWSKADEATFSDDDDSWTSWGKKDT